MPYNEINIALELFCTVICMVLLAYQFADRNKDESDKWFSLMILSNVMMLLGDIGDCYFRGKPGFIVFILENISALFMYYAGAGLMLYGLFRWMLFFANLRTKLSPMWKMVARVCLCVQFLLTITLPFNKLCYITPDNIYVRGEYFYLMQIMPYTIYAMTVFILIRNFRVFKIKEIIYFGFFTLIPVVAVMIQTFKPEYLMLNTATTVGLVALITFIQLQREFERETKIKQLVLKENENLESLRSRQENINYQLIDSLCGAVEAKDFYTNGHSQRVAQYAREIMYRLGGDEQAQQEVYCIGILHDVGKISVHDKIINKKGKLTNDEYEQMKLHTIAGYQILKGVTLIPDLAVGARWHHERYDGTGYPNGLAGENIPLVARIISVADAYDAMTSNRSYHAIMPQKEVRAQIEAGMGTQFDPKIAQIMLDMIDEDIQYDMKQYKYKRVTNILMIDDDKLSHDLVDKLLDNETYNISFASSGEEGIKLLKENKFDLCLLDMEMPDMNGFEVLEWINKNIRKMKVIFLTGSKDISLIQKSEQLGASDYLTKPINGKVLRESVNSVLTHNT